jgi:aspartyl protease family protein
MLRSSLGAFFILAMASLALVSYVTKHGGLSAPIVTTTAPKNVAAAPAPAAATPAKTLGMETVLTADPFGHFAANVDVDGHRIHMLVDTGASFVALTNEDAAALGLRPQPADYRVAIQTANGAGHAAQTHLWRLNISGVEIYDVDALVLPAGVLKTSLLGMSALRKLRNFEFSAGRLVLEQ